MNFLKTLGAFALMVSVGGFAFAASPLLYGQAKIEKGSVSIARGGKVIVQKQSSKLTPVYVDDLILVGPNSKLTLDTIEETVITLGSNAAFQVKPWQDQNKKGFFRMLYGRMRAKAKKVVGAQDRFSMKTATATIGVKGTEFVATVTPQGDALIVVEESVVEVSGADGKSSNVRPDLLSVVVNGKQSSDASLVPAQLKAELEKGLDAPAVTSEAAKALPAEQSLIKSGIVSKESLRSARRELVDIRDSIDLDEPIIPLNGSQELPGDLFENLFTPKVFLPPVG